MIRVTTIIISYLEKNRLFTFLQFINVLLNNLIYVKMDKSLSYTNGVSTISE